MSFLSPLMLLGIIGAAIPVLVHLQGRRKAKVVRFAALDFLMGTDKRLAKRLMLRQLALLIFRVLICLVIPLVLSKPYASCQSEGPDVARGPQAAVLIVDDSLTSGYRLNGESLLSRSLAAARTLIDKLGPEAEVAILQTTDARPGELTRDHLNLREQLGAMEVSYRQAETATAMQRALQLLEGSGHARKTIFILAAATAATIPKADSVPPGAGLAVRLLDPAGEAELPNLAVTDLRVLADNSIGSRGVTVIAEIANYSSRPQVAEMTLHVGQTALARGELMLDPGTRQHKRFSANLDDEARTTEIRVSLSGDDFTADDTRFVVADARDQVPVLLINGDPRTVRHEDELYYLEAALRPGDRSESGTSITAVTPDALGEVDLDAFDVAFLANVRQLPKEQVAALARWVKSGGGLFLAMGDEVDADSYNRNMGPLLAQSLQSPLDLSSGRKKSSEGSLRLSKLELEHPVFSVFSKEGLGLLNATFSQIMLLGPTTQVRDRRVLARYDNGAAALVEARKGAGLLLLFTSTVDREWNDLAIHQGFLPLMQQSVRYLAAKPFQGRQQHVLVGDSVSVKIAPNDARLEVDGPDSTRMVLEGDKISGRKNARLDSVQIPGIYRVQSVDIKGQLHQRPEAAFAANIDPAASDLSRVSAAHLENESSEDTEAAVASKQERRVELWHAIAGFLLLLLLLESSLSLYGGRLRRSRE